VTLRAFDLVFVRHRVEGWRAWRRWLVGWCIRLCSTSDGEGPTFADHVCHVVEAERDDYILAEALGHDGYVYTRLRARYGDTRRFVVRVARHRRLGRANALLMAQRTSELVGRKYGYLKVAAHGLDYALTRFWHASGGHGDAYLFRRLCLMERYPMCSWAEADIWKAGRLPFDTPVSKAQPDDLYDECDSSKDWEWVPDPMVGPDSKEDT
jgi:hypothetical protein